MPFTAYVYLKNGRIATVENCVDITTVEVDVNSGYYRDLFGGTGLSGDLGTEILNTSNGPAGVISFDYVTMNNPASPDVEATQSGVNFARQLSDNVAHEKVRTLGPYKQKYYLFEIATDNPSGPPGLFFHFEEVMGVTNGGPPAL